MVHFEKSKTNQDILIYKHENRSFPLSSKIDPQKEAKRITEVFEDKVYDFIVILGSAHLSLTTWILNHIDLTYLFIVEAEPEIAKITKEYYSKNLPPSLLDKTVFYVEDEYLEIRHWFKNKTSKDVRICINRSQYRLHEDFYQKARDKTIHFYTQKTVNVSTMSRFEKLWLRNIIKNTPYIAKSYGLEEVKGHFSKHKALLIGAGPSLEKHIEVLKNIQKEMILIAVDTSLKILLHHGIVPHFTVVVDPQKINAMYVENIPTHLSDQICFICEPAICQSALRDKKNILFFDTIFSYYKLLREYFGIKGEIDMGGNVSTTAYGVCEYLGFDEVSFIGMDMCFYKDAYHVRGAMHEEYWFSTNKKLDPFETKIHHLMDYKNLIPTKGYKDEWIYQDTKFQLFSKWFEQTEKTRTSNIQFFNSTQRGYPFKGIENVDLKEFIQKRKSAPEVQEVFQSLLKTIQEEKKKLPWADFKERLEKIQVNMNQYLDKVSKGKEIAKKLLRYAHQGRKNKLFLELEEIDRQLLKDFDGKEMINICLQKAIHHIMEKKSKNPSIIESLEDSLYLYNEMEESTQLNLRYMKHLSYD